MGLETIEREGGGKKLPTFVLAAWPDGSALARCTVLDHEMNDLIILKMFTARRDVLARMDFVWSEYDDGRRELDLDYVHPRSWGGTPLKTHKVPDWSPQTHRRFNWFVRLLAPDGMVDRMLPAPVESGAGGQEPGELRFSLEEVEAYWLLGQEHPVWWPEPQFLEWAESVG